MTKLAFLLVLSIWISPQNLATQNTPSYIIYHQKVIQIEALISQKNYKAALHIYEELFEVYDFIFLRDYQIATQLAIQLNLPEKAENYLKAGIKGGWNLKSIKKNGFLQKLWKTYQWKTLKKTYPILRAKYEANLNQKLRKQVKKMFGKDQRKAFLALLKFTSKGQDKYAERKFAPHSEQQMAKLASILKEIGYPGEQLIGNNFWAETILSHHNSISTAYNTKDTLYPAVFGQLLEALSKGQISPYELAVIDDWYRSSKYERKKASYGMLNRPLSNQIPQTNELRKAIYLRPFELREKLEVLQQQTGMNFYMSDRWY